MDSTTRTVRSGNYDDAGTRQRRHAKELQDLAAALRTPEPDRIAALKAAEKKVNEAIDAQTKVNNDTKEPLTPEEIDKATRSRFDPKTGQGQRTGHSTDQGRVRHSRRPQDRRACRPGSRRSPQACREQAVEVRGCPASGQDRQGPGRRRRRRSTISRPPRTNSTARSPRPNSPRSIRSPRSSRPPNASSNSSRIRRTPTRRPTRPRRTRTSSLMPRPLRRTSQRARTMSATCRCRPTTKRRTRSTRPPRT